jgi:hypothetical protein
MVLRYALTIGARHRPLVMTTVTAPGADVLPWACDVEHRHSGLTGCRVEEEALIEWTSTLAERWRALLATVRQWERRRWGDSVIAGWVMEPQRRGAAHVHVILERRGERHELVMRRMATLAGTHGFGFVDTRPHLKKAGGNPSGYLVGYLGKGGKVEAHGDAVRAGLLPRRSWAVAHRIGHFHTMTMAALRRSWWSAGQRQDGPGHAAPRSTGCRRLWDRIRDDLAGGQRAGPLLAFT